MIIPEEQDLCRRKLVDAAYDAIDAIARMATTSKAPCWDALRAALSTYDMAGDSRVVSDRMRLQLQAAVVRALEDGVREDQVDRHVTGAMHARTWMMLWAVHLAKGGQTNASTS